MRRVVCKFGGSSLADAEQVKKVVQIVREDPDRVVIVPSAPGRRYEKDAKVTDLLYVCHELAGKGLDIAEPFGRIADRYMEIARAFGAASAIEQLLVEARRQILAGRSRDFVASRGEYLSGRLLSAILDATFVEPTETIRFARDGGLDPKTYSLLQDRLDAPGVFVLPGFYGVDSEGKVKTFSRGGSDVTGAIAARAIHAEVYENWTDVSGCLMADPSIVPNPKPIKEITYEELRELSYMGASVLHDEATFPAREARIPINIRNTNDPAHPGTMIVSERDYSKGRAIGVAGRPDFTMFTIHKALMNNEHGFGRKVLEIVETHGVSYEHTPTSIDTLSVIVKDEEVEGKTEALVKDFQRILEPDKIDVTTDLALIATVGLGMMHTVGVAARLFTALADAGVNVRIIDQGSSETNIIVGVETKDLHAAVAAIYHAFVNDQPS